MLKYKIGTVYKTAPVKLVEVLEKAQGIIAVSEMNKKDIISLGANPHKVHVIHNGIQYHEIQNIPANNAEIRNELGLNKTDFVLITVGRNRPIKRLELLFKAISLTKNKRIKCINIGPKENIAQLAKEYDIEDHVRFVENIPSDILNEKPPYMKLIQLYKASNIYVSTSYVESFGMAGADALACGIPVIIGQRHGLKDVLIESKTGFVMKEETPEELATIITDLIPQKEKLENINTVISTSVETLCWNNIAKQTNTVYKKLIMGSTT